MNTEERVVSYPTSYAILSQGSNLMCCRPTFSKLSSTENRFLVLLLGATGSIGGSGIIRR
jgi:hypothetical protein